MSEQLSPGSIYSYPDEEKNSLIWFVLREKNFSRNENEQPQQSFSVIDKSLLSAVKVLPEDVQKLQHETGTDLYFYFATCTIVWRQMTSTIAGKTQIRFVGPYLKTEETAV